MHDPMTVAHEIYLGKKTYKDKTGRTRYRSPILTIWHCDPEKDRTDDSCGWFIRSRHVDKDLLARVRREFAFNFEHNYWFNEAGYPVFSVMGTALNMYNQAAWTYFMWLDGNKGTDRASRRKKRFMRKHLAEILSFAENPTDSMHTSITMKYGVERKEDRVNSMADMVLTDILRKLRPWYKHPRWHVHHWKITVPVWQRFYARWFRKCADCGTRGSKSSWYGNWDGDRHWCSDCEGKKHKASPINLQP